MSGFQANIISIIVLPLNFYLIIAVYYLFECYYMIYSDFVGSYLFCGPYGVTRTSEYLPFLHHRENESGNREIVSSLT